MEEESYNKNVVDTKGLIDVFDNVLEPHVAELIDYEMKAKNHWHYDYNSNRGGLNKHWHIFCGHDKIADDWNFLTPIWETAKEKYDFKNSLTHVFPLFGYEAIQIIM